MNWDQLRLLVINPKTGKAISKETLQKAFPDELENGLAALKSKIARRYVDLLDDPQKNERAVLWGLANIWRIVDPNRGDTRVGVAIGDNTDSINRKLSIEFVMPDPKRIAATDAAERQQSESPSPQPLKPIIDVKANPPTSNMPIIPLKKPFDWMS
jgi:hypothetical protein